MNSETFKGRPRLLSYPSPPDREILANFKHPKETNVFSRFYNNSEDRKHDTSNNKKECIPTPSKR